MGQFGHGLVNVVFVYVFSYVWVAYVVFSLSLVVTFPPGAIFTATTLVVYVAADVIVVSRIIATKSINSDFLINP